MAQRWIEKEFLRTGLPKSGLAGYLGVDNAAVTRIMNGERALSSDEEATIKAFFSIVPKDDPNRSDEFDRLRRREAINRLRSTKIRETVSATLANWLSKKAEQFRPRNAMPSPAQDSYMSMVRGIVDRKSSFRSDQIVALCRLLEINLSELVSGNGVEARNHFSDSYPEDLPGQLAQAASAWIEHGATPYQFDRTFDAPAPRSGGHRYVTVSLLPADSDPSDFASLSPLLIPDNSHAPRFEQGQVIYLDDRAEPRKGDYVAVMLVGSHQVDEAKSTLGRFLYASREKVGLLSPRNVKVELDRSEVVAVRRIAYCKL